MRHHEEEAISKAYDAQLTRRLLRYLRPYRGRVALAVGLLIGSAALEMVGPWLTKIALDRAIRGVGGRRFAADDPEALARVTFDGMTASQVVADQRAREGTGE